jgi:hypothetical protein
MLEQAMALHLKEHNPSDANDVHTQGLRRLRRAERGTPVTVVINPLNFTIKKRDWPRLIDLFFTGKSRGMVDRFYLITTVNDATDLSNFHTINDFNYRFRKDFANRLSGALVVDHTVFGRAEGDLSGDFQVVFKDYGDSPKVGLLTFEPTERGHNHLGAVSLLHTGRLGDEADCNSLKTDFLQKDLVITVSYPTDRTGLKQRQALDYIRDLGFASVPKHGAPEGWEQRHIRCIDTEEAHATLQALLAPPESGENPLLAMIDHTFATGSSRFSFDSKHGDIFHLFCSITGCIPTVPIGEGSFVCDTGGMDLDVLAERCQKFNMINSSILTQFLSITDGDRTRWIKPPPVPERMLRLGMGSGPGFLLIPCVPIDIQSDFVEQAVRSVFSDFIPGTSFCEFVELPSKGGVGIKFWVPDKARAEDLCFSLGSLSLEVVDGDLVTTTSVQGVFRLASSGSRKRPSGVLMGTPTPRHKKEAREIGAKMRLEGLVMTEAHDAVSELLEGFRAVEVVSGSPARAERPPLPPSSPSPLASAAGNRGVGPQSSAKGKSARRNRGTRSSRLSPLAESQEEEEDDAVPSDDSLEDKEDVGAADIRPDPSGLGHVGDGSEQADEDALRELDAEFDVIEVDTGANGTGSSKSKGHGAKGGRARGGKNKGKGPGTEFSPPFTRQQASSPTKAARRR